MKDFMRYVVLSVSFFCFGFVLANLGSVGVCCKDIKCENKPAMKCCGTKSCECRDTKSCECHDTKSCECHDVKSCECDKSLPKRVEALEKKFIPQQIIEFYLPDCPK